MSIQMHSKIYASRFAKTIYNLEWMEYVPDRSYSKISIFILKIL
jgi:hypothetical protein